MTDIKENKQNIDLTEIKKFEILASKWWDIESKFKPLHDINPLRVDYINERVDLDGKKVIDIGCGGGILSEVMSKLGADVKGIDMGEASLTLAKIRKKKFNLNIDYEKITPEEIAERESSQYDVVTCLEMLEHVPDPSSVIKACTKLVKPAGQIFFFHY